MLESEIKKLNAQLETLNDNFERFFSQSFAAPSITVAPLPVKEEVVKEEVAKEEVAKEEAVKEEVVKKEVVKEEAAANDEINQSDLKALFLNISRNNPDKKGQLKALLSTFNAKKVSDIKPEDRVKAKAALEKL